MPLCIVLTGVGHWHSNNMPCMACMGLLRDSSDAKAIELIFGASRPSIVGSPV